MILAIDARPGGPFAVESEVAEPPRVVFLSGWRTT